jgi:hypothetical protein
MIEFLWNARHFGLRLAIRWLRSEDQRPTNAIAAKR